MRNKFDNILLGILWLLLSTLGACFWFNTRFGFNILSKTHWQHLAYMQVTQTQIKPSFYISIIVGVFCIVYGLYIFIRPRFRKIKIPQSKTTIEPPQTTQPIIKETDDFALTRPQRLISSNTTNIPQKTEVLTAPVPGTTQPAPLSPTKTLTPPTPDTSKEPDTELEDIFKSAGYIIKKTPNIRGYKVPLIAVSHNETMWIGARHMETSTMQSIIDSFKQIFSETLEDVEIQIIGFIVSPGDIDNPTAKNILTFKNTEELRNYIAEHPNPPADSDTLANIEAFSEFISTVIDYIGNI
jgi:hypothetical protein